MKETGLRVLKRFAAEVVGEGGFKQAQELAKEGTVDSDYAIGLLCQIAEYLAEKAFPDFFFPS